ncbi:hypothetical protein N2152v2_004777 [Parachlorella kessleri]
MAAEGGTQPSEGDVGNESPKSPPSPESSNSGDTSSFLSPHYDTSKDVVLRMEFLTEQQMKAVVLSVWAAVLVGLGLLAMGLDFKLDKDPQYLVHDKTVPTVNVVFASILLAGASGTLGLHLRRTLRATATGKRWSLRRSKGVRLAAFQLTLQVVNLVFFLVPNAYVLSHDCAWMGSVVLWTGAARWTCWNTIFLGFWTQAHNAQPVTNPQLMRRINRWDGAVMDAPLWVHWPKLGLWVAFEAVLLALTGYLDHLDLPVKTSEPAGTELKCRDWQYNCAFDGPSLGLAIAMEVIIVAYATAYLLTIRRSFQLLAKLPYKQYRMANLNVRLRALAFLFFILCTVVYIFVHINSCASLIFSWLGFLPMQASSRFVMTCIAAGSAFLYMPKKPGEMGILQVWLQEFAWTEKDVPHKRQERSSSLPKGSYEHFCMDCEPMFCFETAVKMMYWSYLCYDKDETKGTPFTMDTALSLYGLDHFELFWEKTLDTKAIMGWNDSTVVIAFRGTTSLANMRSDLQVWMKSYPVRDGSCCLGTRPMVHMGFHRAWFANKFNEKILSRLAQVLKGCTQQQADAGTGKDVTVHVTGHSLGGALATLCAFDIRQRCPFAAYTTNIRVYTFGAPRTGNHAFAELYNEALPDTWHIINNDDMITRGGKFFVLYKRAGHRVLINRRGDMLVRPSFVESSIRNVPGVGLYRGWGTIRDHLLTSYQKAMVAVVQAQFGAKSFHDGKDGVLSLASQLGTRAALQGAGLAVDQLGKLASSSISPETFTLGTGPSGGKWRRLLMSMRRSISNNGSTGGTSTGSSSAGRDTPGARKAQGTQEQLQAVPAAGDLMWVTVTVEPHGDEGEEEEAVSEEGGIMHQRCKRRLPRCEHATVCSLMEPPGRRAGAKPCQAVANPMADPSNRSTRPLDIDGQLGGYGPRVVQQGRGQDVELGLLPHQAESPPASPHMPLTSTRGHVAEQPQFDLVLPSSTQASTGSGVLKAVQEGEGSGMSPGGGEKGMAVVETEMGRTTAPAVVVIGSNKQP